MDDRMGCQGESESDRNIWFDASDGKIEQVLMYLDQGMSVDCQDAHGYTPLLAAVSYNHMELVQILLQRGANVNLGDNDSDTPLHYCETKECAELLVAHGANPEARNADLQSALDVAREDERCADFVTYLEQITKQDNSCTDLEETGP